MNAAALPPAATCGCRKPGPRGRWRALVGVVALGLALGPVATAWAQAPKGFPDPGAPLSDPDFKVRTRQFGLDRQVEMYQWRIGENGYERVWHGALIDSAGFDDAHANPPRLPIDSRRWWAGKPTLDGRPLDPSVLRSLGEWRVLRPNFSRLPVNLAASFQPEGEGLGSAENPLEPRIGDVRVSWRELVLPPLDGRVVLRDGTWQLADAADGGAGDAPPGAAAGPAQRLWPFFGIALVVVAAGVVALRRRHRRHD